MAFRILYIEDEEPHFTKIEEAVAEYNLRLEDPSDPTDGQKLLLDWLKSPYGLKDRLDLGFDVVLADVFFKDGGRSRPKLKEILDEVESWKNTRLGDISLPVIAYTGMGKSALKMCLEERSRLFDLWDKNTAEEDYVAWRMSRLSAEVARERPDALMQRLIREMPSGASWHSEVTSMAEGYNRGCSERDQIERMTSSVVEIGKRIGCKEYTKKAWNNAKEWEALGLASSEQMRGHARHVANVFWLGYYLIHHPVLRDSFEDYWGVLRQKRKGWEMPDGQRLEDISKVWFLAAFFHDSAYCCQKTGLLLERTRELFLQFDNFQRNSLQMENVWKPAFLRDMKKIVEEFDDKTPDGAELVKQLWAVTRDSISAYAPDHGLTAAHHLLNSTSGGTIEWEAARAMALHNCFPDLGLRAAAAITWQKEPISCLLIVCDQLQAWDRERDDDHFAKWPSPERAELSRLEVVAEKERPIVRVGINYIASSRVLRSRDWFAGVKNELEGILRDHPDHCLSKIQNPWPFQLIVEPSLSGIRLNTEMSYGVS